MMKKCASVALARLLILLYVALLVMFLQCGGGFKADSPNSVEFEQPLFGGDTAFMSD